MGVRVHRRPADIAYGQTIKGYFLKSAMASMAFTRGVN